MPRPRASRAVAAGLAIALLLLGALYGVYELRHERDLSRRRADVAEALASLRLRLQDELHARLYLTEALAAYVKTHPDLSRAGFRELARLLAGQREAVRSLQLAKDTVISHVYPVAGNEAALGLHLLRLPRQREAVARALRLRDTVVAGPVDLVQGGTAFVGRTPILIPGADGASRYWGLATVVIDMEGLFRVVDLPRWTRELRLVIQRTDGEDPEGTVLHGEPALLDAEPVTTTLAIPNGSWRLAAVPRNGWNPGSVHDVEYWLFAVLLTAAAGGLVGLLVHRPAQLAETNRWLQQEIADHKRTARLLQRSRDELAGQKSFQETLLHTIPVPAFMKDAEGRYLTCNPAFEAFLGRTRDEIVGRTVFDLAPPDLARRYRDADEALLQSGSLQSYEADVQRGNGERHTVQFYKAAFRDADGSAVGLVGAMLDVTERKETERQLREAHRRAERAVEERTRFVAAASHDLRQPLHALGLFVGRLQEQARGSGRLEELARDIRLCTDSLVELFDALLDLSKLDAGAVSPAMEDVPLRPLLDRIAADHAPVAAERGLRLRVAGRALTARSDPVLLERLLRNLAANAVRYTARGGVLLACRRRDGMLRIEVWDTGPGIPEAEQEAVFREFYQSRNGDRTRGLGLGLSIVQRLAALLETPVGLCSRPGHGSVFRIQVPEGRPAAVPAAAGHGPQELAGLRVLAVDDDPRSLAAVRGLLEGWGCRVETAADGETALAKAESTAPDMVLCDYRLAGEERGPEIVHRLRAVWGPGLPAALVTGDTSTGVRSEAAAAGCRLLLKPLRPAKLRALLTGLARQDNPSTGPEPPPPSG